MKKLFAAMFAVAIAMSTCMSPAFAGYFWTGDDVYVGAFCEDEDTAEALLYAYVERGRDYGNSVFQKMRDTGDCYDIQRALPAILDKPLHYGVTPTGTRLTVWSFVFTAGPRAYAIFVRDGGSHNYPEPGA